WGMVLLARRHGLTPLASFVAAALWICSGPFVSLFNLWHHYAGACWMPWVAWAAERAWGQRRARDFVALGAVAGLQLLAGSADMVMLTALLVAAQLLVVHVRWSGAALRSNLRLLAGSAGAGAIALGLSAGLWLTAVDAARGADRWALPEGLRTYWSVHPLGMLEVAFPGLWSTLPLSEFWRGLLFESREPFLASLYLGLGTWALALSSLGPGRGQDRRPWVLLGVAAAALLVALGRHAPFYSLAFAGFPPLRVLRYPMKAMVLAAFALCLAAGHGFDRWRQADAERRRWPAVSFLALVGLGNLVAVVALAAAGPRIAARLLAASPASAAILASRARLLAGGALLAAAWLALIVSRRGGRPALAALVAGLAVAELSLYHRDLIPAAPVALYKIRPEVVDLVRREPRPRIYAYEYALREVVRRPPPLAEIPEGWSPDLAMALSYQLSLAPATAGRWDLDSGWDADYRGLYPHMRAQLGIMLRRAEGTPMLLRLLRMGAITHVIAFHEEGFEDLVPLASLRSLRTAPLRVFAVPGTLPPTYATGSVHHAASEFAVMQRIFAPDFDPAREVILEDPEARSTAAGPVGASRIVLRRPDRVRLEAELETPGYVVLVDGFSAGWRATVDGRRAPLLRANLVFRAVAVPAGRHTIDMVYRPPAVLVGLALSALTAAACTAALLRPQR
ncbi:MAG TPA: YfhO family protein, partial [Vicinamibacteria bacterium]